MAIIAEAGAEEPPLPSPLTRERGLRMKTAEKFQPEHRDGIIGELHTGCPRNSL